MMTTFDFYSAFISQIASGQADLKIKLRLANDFIRTVATVVFTVTNLLPKENN